MMWVAIVYSIVAMTITHLVGRRLVPINFARLRVEADFRFQLMRFRENVEAVAFARGESLEHRNALDRFGAVVRNWWQLIRAQRDLNFTRESIGQLNGAVPLLVAAPGFFLGRLTLGNLAQAQFAYGQVSGALTWLVNAYQEIAQWRASIERLATFVESIEANQAKLASAERVQVTGDDQLKLVDLRLNLPDGKPLLACRSVSIEPGERVALVGPSGSGKTTLFRAIAGMWPFGRGTIVMPPSSKALLCRSVPTCRSDAASCRNVSRGGDGLSRREDPRSVRAAWARSSGRAAGRDGALGAAALGSRGATAGAGARAAARAGVALPRSCDRRTRRRDGAADLRGARPPAASHRGAVGHESPVVERYHTRRWRVWPTEAGPSNSKRLEPAPPPVFSGPLEGLQMLHHVPDLLGRQARAPLGHERRAVEGLRWPERDGAEHLVLASLDLELGGGEVARRNLEVHPGRSLAVAVHAVADPAGAVVEVLSGQRAHMLAGDVQRLDGRARSPAPAARARRSPSAWSRAAAQHPGRLPSSAQSR
jgi:energy-coupling factor transporter ATP-binding protein EcfA2